MMIKAGRTQFRESLFHCGITLVLWFTACSAESLAQSHGPLRVHAENPRYFADASGQAILLTGSHTWNNLVDIGPVNPPDVKGTKVVLSDTDHLWGIGGDAVWVWKTFMRGLNPIFMDTYDGKVLGKVRPQDDGPRRAMGQALRMSREIDLAKSTPRNELVSTGYCLAEPGVTYISFAPEGGTFSLDLSAASGSFTAEWVDPVAGTHSPAGKAIGGARQSFSAPSDAAVVLFIKRSSQP